MTPQFNRIMLNSPLVARASRFMALNSKTAEVSSSCLVSDFNLFIHKKYFFQKFSS